MAAGADTLRAAVDLPPVDRSAAAARRLVGQLLDAWAAEVFRDDATLLAECAGRPPDGLVRGVPSGLLSSVR